jgi:hypothetical protein
MVNAKVFGFGGAQIAGEADASACTLQSIDFADPEVHGATGQGVNAGVAIGAPMRV